MVHTFVKPQIITVIFILTPDSSVNRSYSNVPSIVSVVLVAVIKLMHLMLESKIYILESYKPSCQYKCNQLMLY